MTPEPAHRCVVLGAPWPGVHSTTIDSARHYGRHWHATFGVGLLVDGAQTSASGRGMVDAYAGDVITTNPGEVHDGRPLGGPSRRWRMVYFDPSAFTELVAPQAGVTTDSVLFTRPVIQDAPLKQSLLRLFERLDRWHAGPHAGAAERLACEEALACTAEWLMQRHGTAAAAPQVPGEVTRARDRLADELLSPPSLAELAAMSGCSRYQLLRRFEKAYGVPPHAWLQQQRAERARTLIRQGAALAEAAAGCGFADQSHMTRSFMRLFGFTPGAWQRALSRGRAA
jgi:AraC-like DNA-binding protein